MNPYLTHYVARAHADELHRRAHTQRQSTESPPATATRRARRTARTLQRARRVAGIPIEAIAARRGG